jgi:hypothetical protein
MDDEEVGEGSGTARAGESKEGVSANPSSTYDQKLTM